MASKKTDFEDIVPAGDSPPRPQLSPKSAGGSGLHRPLRFGPARSSGETSHGSAGRQRSDGAPNQVSHNAPTQVSEKSKWRMLSIGADAHSLSNTIQRASIVHMNAAQVRASLAMHIQAGKTGKPLPMLEQIEDEPARSSDKSTSGRQQPASLALTEMATEKTELTEDFETDDEGLERTRSSRRITEHLAKVAPKREAVFADAAAMKEKVRHAISAPVYNVFDYYHETGCWQAVAKSAPFENVTLAVIAANALWISYDTDANKSATLMEADVQFQIVENFFCIYFFCEWLFRFMAFKNKLSGLRDSWFVFDSSLVAMMVFETWLMSAIIYFAGGGGGAGLGNMSILKVFRLLRLTRMARMARLLRAIPELMIMIKGMKVAMRSVLFTLVLLGVIVYIFAITLTQVLEGTEVGDDYFKSVPNAMNSLLLHATIPDQADIVEMIGDEHFLYRILILLYILFASLTVMNMLVGVLCEVVSIVSAVEKETMLVNFVKQQLAPMLDKGGLTAGSEQTVGKEDFIKILEQPEAARALQEVGVDVVGLVDFTDFIFQNGKELSFSDCMDLVLQLRGTNNATVKDIVDLRKHVMTELARVEVRNTERFALLLDTVEACIPEQEDFDGRCEETVQQLRQTYEVNMH